MAFKQVGIFASISGPLVAESMLRVAAVLKAQGIEVRVEESELSATTLPEIKAQSREAICQTADLVIAIGGDGSMLSAARDVTPFGVPLLQSSKLSEMISSALTRLLMSSTRRHERQRRWA